jgi:hypothetical protein
MVWPLFNIIYWTYIHICAVWMYVCVYAVCMCKLHLHIWIFYRTYTHALRTVHVVKMINPLAKGYVTRYKNTHTHKQLHRAVIVYEIDLVIQRSVHVENHYYYYWHANLWACKSWVFAFLNKSYIGYCFYDLKFTKLNVYLLHVIQCVYT